MSDSDSEDLALFAGGDDDDSSSEEEVDEELAAQMAVAQARLERKQAAAKSLIIYRINPTGTEIDLDELAVAIRALENDGASWGENHQTEPLAFGLFYLLIPCTIVDSIADTDAITESLEGLEGVSSVEISDWQKL